MHHSEQYQGATPLRFSGLSRRVQSALASAGFTTCEEVVACYWWTEVDLWKLPHIGSKAQAEIRLMCEGPGNV